MQRRNECSTGSLDLGVGERVSEPFSGAEQNERLECMRDRVLSELVDLVASEGVSEKLKPETEKLLRKLADYPGEPQAWQPLAAGFFGFQLPSEVKSAWLFALRDRGVFGNERHPNSWQRSIALEGEAEFELLVNGQWEKHRICGSSLEDRRAVSRRKMACASLPAANAPASIRWPCPS